MAENLYIKKPEPIQAFRFSGTTDSAGEIVSWAAARKTRIEQYREAHENGEFSVTLVVPTVNGRKRVNTGDYISYTEVNGFDVTDARTFESSYDTAEV